MENDACEEGKDVSVSSGGGDARVEGINPKTTLVVLLAQSHRQGRTGSNVMASSAAEGDASPPRAALLPKRPPDIETSPCHHAGARVTTARV